MEANSPPDDLDSRHEQFRRYAPVSDWCNVLEDLSDEDLAELRDWFELPVRLAR